MYYILVTVHMTNEFEAEVITDTMVLEYNITITHKRKSDFKMRDDA